MAICSWCEREMTDDSVNSCSGNTHVDYPDGTKLPSTPYDPDYGDADKRCHDCNVKRGGFHHPGCDMERCPRCKGQLISCGCLDEEDEEDTEC
jgi:hypothetical protein